MNIRLQIAEQLLKFAEQLLNIGWHVGQTLLISCEIPQCFNNFQQIVQKLFSKLLIEL